MISVIIPCTRKESVETAINSIKLQTYKDVEIIVINDNPENDIMNLVSVESNIKVINNAKNIGLSATRNAGLRESTGKYVYFLDDDDHLDNDNALSDLLTLCENNNVDIALTCTFKSENDFEVINKTTLVDYYMSIENDNILRPVSTKLYKRDYLIQNDLYFYEGYVAEEDDFLYRLIIKNPNISVYNKKVYHYSKNTEGSIMKSIKYKCDKSYINVLARERIEKSNLDGMVKAKILMNINNSIRRVNGVNASLF